MAASRINVEPEEQRSFTGSGTISFGTIGKRARITINGSQTVTISDVDSEVIFVLAGSCDLHFTGNIPEDIEFEGETCGEISFAIPPSDKLFQKANAAKNRARTNENGFDNINGHLIKKGVGWVSMKENGRIETYRGDLFEIVNDVKYIDGRAILPASNNTSLLKRTNDFSIKHPLALIAGTLGVGILWYIGKLFYHISKACLYSSNSSISISLKRNPRNLARATLPNEGNNSATDIPHVPFRSLTKSQEKENMQPSSHSTKTTTTSAANKPLLDEFKLSDSKHSSINSSSSTPSKTSAALPRFSVSATTSTTMKIISRTSDILAPNPVIETILDYALSVTNPDKKTQPAALPVQSLPFFGERKLVETIFNEEQKLWRNFNDASVAILSGEEHAKVIEIIERDPRILVLTADEKRCMTIRGLSGHCAAPTLYRTTLATRDTQMAKKVRDKLTEVAGIKEANAQYEAQFPPEWEEAEVKRWQPIFEQMENVLQAIKHSDWRDITLSAAPFEISVKRESEVAGALAYFKLLMDETRQEAPTTGRHFNERLLLHAYEDFCNHIDDLGGDRTHPRALLWLQHVIGNKGIQSYFPASYMQAFYYGFFSKTIDYPLPDAFPWLTRVLDTTFIVKLQHSSFLNLCQSKTKAEQAFIPSHRINNPR